MDTLRAERMFQKRFRSRKPLMAYAKRVDSGLGVL